MIKKIKELFSSIRFWQVIAGGVVYYLGTLGWLPQELVNTIMGILGVSVTIGTSDKVSKNLGG